MLLNISGPIIEGRSRMGSHTYLKKILIFSEILQWSLQKRRVICSARSNGVKIGGIHVVNAGLGFTK
jgi:hypothetical protein